MHRQLANELQLDGTRRGLALSATKELEPGTRAMLLLAEGLFGLDVLSRGDTLRIVVRNLSDGELEICDPNRPDGLSVAFGEVATYEPGRTSTEFALGDGDDRVNVRATLATLRFVARGTIRVSAQAIVRQDPVGVAR